MTQYLLTQTVYWSTGLTILFNLIPVIFAASKKIICKDSGVSVYLNSLILWICLLLSSLTTLLYVGYFAITDTLPSATTLLAIAQTNVSEGLAYLKDNFSNFMSLARTSLFLLVLCILLFSVFKLQKSPISALYSKIKILFLPLTFILSCFLIYKTSYNFITEPFYGLKDGLKSYTDFQRESGRRAHLFNFSDCKDSGFPGLYVLVIGESQNKNHMNAYGYSRKTTPWLTSLTEKSNMVLLEQAFSNHTHSVPALTYALTAKSQYDSLNLQNSPSIIELAKCAGFTTYWVSNQVKFGAWDTPITVISSSADHQKFINHNMGYTTNTTFFDERLVDELKKMKICSEKSLVVVHLMGSHASYSDRYPKSFNLWGNRKKIDTYDNSVAYTDFVLNQIYLWASKQPNFMSLIYLSDHSEAVDKNLSHDASQFDWDMTEIPMFIDFSEDFSRSHPALLQALKNNKDKPFTNDMLYDTLISILGIKTSFHNQENDLTSSEYNKRLEDLKTLHGARSFRDYKNEN